MNRTINIADHLEKWGCNNHVTKAAVTELLRMLGHHVKDEKVTLKD